MIYRAHRGHIPVCFRGIFNERLNALSARTEHTIADAPVLLHQVCEGDMIQIIVDDLRQPLPDGKRAALGRPWADCGIGLHA